MPSASSTCCWTSRNHPLKRSTRRKLQKATATANLQQLFSNPEFLTRVDVNGDGRADQLDLRVLLRHKSGLRGTLLAEQEVSADIIRLLLDQQ